MTGPSMRELIGTPTPSAPPTPPKKTPGNYHPALQDLIDNAPQRLNTDKQLDPETTFDEPESDFDERDPVVIPWGGVGVLVALLLSGVVVARLLNKRQQSQSTPATAADPYDQFIQELRSDGAI